MPLGAQLTSAVLERPHQLFLLGVHRNRRLPGGHLLLHLIIQVLELRVPVGMLAALEDLPIGLQAVLQLVQQLRP